MLDLHKLQFIELNRLISSGSQAILLVGDKGVGKKTLIRRVLEHFKVDLVEFPALSINEARSIKHIIIRKSVQTRVFLIDGDGATVQAYNAMLKTLEEPPRDVIFIIAASRAPIQTIVSRCNYIIVPPFTHEELKEVLSYKGMGERAILSVVGKSYGSVAEAVKVYERQEEKQRLVPYLKALKDRDLTFVLKQVKLITRDDLRILIELVDDVMISRYGLLNVEAASSVPVTSDFLATVKEALQAGSIPCVCWMRAWFLTA